MSAIIKSGCLGELAEVRPFTMPNPAPPIAVVKQDDEHERLHRRIAALETELKDRDAIIAALRADIERAREEGKGLGREQGLAEAEDRQTARLAALQAAIELQQTDLSERLGSLERLSFLIAQECLDKVFGDPEESADFVRQVIENQIAKIDRAMLVGIEVSKEDFPDTGGIDEVMRNAGIRSVAVAATGDLPSGGCRMRLRLGTIDVGLNQQWGALREMLSELASPEAMP